MKSHAIRTARVPARLSQRRVTRPTLERWLAEADPARHGLPAQAIVLVRRLQSPWTALVHPETGTRYGALASALTGAVAEGRQESARLGIDRQPSLCEERLQQLDDVERVSGGDLVNARGEPPRARG